MCKIKNRLIASLMIILMLVTACTPIKNELDSREYNTELKVDSSMPWPDAPDKIDSAFRSSLLDFAWGLFQVSSENQGNILISPASVYLALGMTYNGSDGETRQAMLDTLKAANISSEEFNEACRDYISILRVMGEKAELNDELSNMGMEIAFDPNSADFSLMLENPGDARENLYIGEVRHKTFCRVDELGTEASAVTSVEMRVTSAGMDPEIQLIFDRPFIYGIVDEVTGAPLFLGIMENPLE